MDVNRIDQQIELQEGRVLGDAEYGPSQGTSVFYCHGFPSSWLDWRLFCIRRAYWRRIAAGHWRTNLEAQLYTRPW